MFRLKDYVDLFVEVINFAFGVKEVVDWGSIISVGLQVSIGNIDQ